MKLKKKTALNGIIIDISIIIYKFTVYYHI